MARVRVLTILLAAGLLVASCGGSGGSGGAKAAAPATTAASGTTTATTVAPTTTAKPRPGVLIDPGDGGNYAPAIDPANFVAAIDNPWLPLRPGAHWRYKGVEDGEAQQVDITVTSAKRQIGGISATVVRDVVLSSEDGSVIEATDDWFAQDRDGNVWYLGEKTAEYDHGKVSSRAGSWEYGKGGALPGIAMRAAPSAGDAYRQEYLKGEAEDLAKVKAAGGSVKALGRTYGRAVTITEWTPLEPKVVEEKTYAPGVGQVTEVNVAGSKGRFELVSFTPGRG